MKMFKKNPLSVVILTWDFSKQMVSTETISTIGSFNSTAPGDLIFTGQAIVGQTVTAKVGGGTVGKIYVASCGITTSLGQTLGAELGISVNDPSDYP